MSGNTLFYDGFMYILYVNGVYNRELKLEGQNQLFIIECHIFCPKIIVSREISKELAFYMLSSKRHLIIAIYGLDWWKFSTMAILGHKTKCQGLSIKQTNLMEWSLNWVVFANNFNLCASGIYSSANNIVIFFAKRWLANIRYVINKIIWYASMCSSLLPTWSKVIANIFLFQLLIITDCSHNWFSGSKKGITNILAKAYQPYKQN